MPDPVSVNDVKLLGSTRLGRSREDTGTVSGVSASDFREIQTMNDDGDDRC